ncbi:hypothetical protein T11_5378 [Trichinella zimbabwensis]|uniref:Uncharacterized protein n=1 Tax=Trichinella zimbabwensis TaxID=268475 RepID=A0A0V1I4I3_9BILA|nr:hypothetical protein T11_5378 [Trichinella zimbabwensis]
MNALMQQQCRPQKSRGRHCASLYARMSDAFAPVCHRDVDHDSCKNCFLHKAKFIHQTVDPKYCIRSKEFYARLLLYVVIVLIEQGDAVFNIDDLNDSMYTHIRMYYVYVEIRWEAWVIGSEPKERLILCYCCTSEIDHYPTSVDELNACGDDSFPFLSSKPTVRGPGHEEQSGLAGTCRFEKKEIACRVQFCAQLSEEH